MAERVFNSCASTFPAFLSAFQIKALSLQQETAQYVGLDFRVVLRYEDNKETGQ